MKKKLSVITEKSKEIKNMSRYEEIKKEWIKENPDYTQDEYEEFIKRLSDRLGV